MNIFYQIVSICVSNVNISPPQHLTISPPQLYLIQIACFHTQELVHRYYRTDSSDEDAEHHHRAGSDSEHLPCDEVEHLRLVHEQCVHSASQHAAGNERSEQAEQHIVAHERRTDEAPRRAHELHRVYGEATGVDA